MTDSINYGRLMHDAMRELLARVLQDVVEGGLPGEHHFFITFETQADGVDIPGWLREKYPKEMTIVMQEWFENLKVDDDGFSVTLNFGDEEVTMAIPFDAILTFVDPSVEFGLRFEATDEPEIAMEIIEDTPMIHVEEAEDEPHRDAEVVSLDSFRK